MNISRLAMGLAALVLAACGGSVTGGGGGEAGGPGGQCPDPNDPNVHYASQNPDACALVDLACNEQQTGFNDACGCGCIGPTEPTACPDPNDPAVTYASTDPESCQVIDFACSEGYDYFGGECGCGCIRSESACPDPNDPKVHYFFQDPNTCAAADIVGCAQGQTSFDDACGCGCIDTVCVDLDEEACAASLVCMPSYPGVCDCACENGEPGCTNCPASCFPYGGCAFAGE